MIPHITLYIVTDPEGDPIPSTAAFMARNARDNAEEWSHEDWQKLYRLGYRVMKLRCQDANSPVIQIEGNNGCNQLTIQDLGHRKLHISVSRNCVRTFDQTGSEETVLNDFLNQMK